MSRFWNWKTKLMLVFLVVFGVFIAIMMKDRNPDPNVAAPTYQRWLDCYGYGASVERDWEYSIIWDTCVTIRTNQDGSTTRVMANLDMGLGSEGAVE